MTLSKIAHEGEYPVLWSIPGICAWCEERMRQGDDASRTPDGQFICGSCAQEARKELANELSEKGEAHG